MPFASLGLPAAVTWTGVVLMRDEARTLEGARRDDMAALT
ncbi:MAG: hypothetical protein RL721_1667, partial [Candidatus Eisenbacteria bacterium]